MHNLCANKLFPPTPQTVHCFCMAFSLLFNQLTVLSCDSTEWIAFHSMFLNIHGSSEFTALMWLVPHETAAIWARSVYTIQPCTITTVHTNSTNCPHLIWSPSRLKPAYFQGPILYTQRHLYIKDPFYTHTGIYTLTDTQSLSLMFWGFPSWCWLAAALKIKQQFNVSKNGA